MSRSRILIYGATGYTGKLVAREAARRGLDVVLAGRDRHRLDDVAREHGFEARAVALDDAAGLRAALADVAAVLHIAGPFSRTSKPMADACLETGTHYLDVTGEIDVFEALARRGEEALRAGVTLLPGVGFDVVPSDCLAVHVAKRIDEPKRLRIGLAGLGGGASRGTARTMVESLADGLRIRHQGVLVPRPFGRLEHRFDLGAGPLRALALPLADLASAFHSTGIPNIETYVVASGSLPNLLRLVERLRPILRLGFVQRFLSDRIDRLPEGPSDEARESGRSLVLAEVEGAGGLRAAAMLETPSGYAITQVAAVEAARRVAEGLAPIGFQTPATAFGPDFVLECSNSRRTDL
ncbi:MAG: saccharopine dehydrogenase NADP-binding domain-containing protein [Deltaproteobacteria bacterium]|nr:saccharopine dehydrogenase NADP-binding domain-containing protein [Deltaproteobacteria bacterium]